MCILLCRLTDGMKSSVKATELCLEQPPPQPPVRLSPKKVTKSKVTYWILQTRCLFKCRKGTNVCVYCIGSSFLPTGFQLERQNIFSEHSGRSVMEELLKNQIFAIHALSGVGSVALGTALTYPLDTIKTLIQDSSPTQCCAC
ncbi:hypothetical protein DVH24_007264 [Malus domestica]|uniref:Uncharacterized protein n=1 Tax=Malus domestica TaxID=3750 RepID=A0A498HEV9_MALDO|nr:hypothetical protein DVH24_007264 [Malus domestica]